MLIDKIRRKLRLKILNLYLSIRFFFIKRKRRFDPGTVNILGLKLNYVDGPSLYFMLKEIFLEEIYKMKNFNANGLIIDGGANIGLSCLYFKLKYPSSRIIAFEPDKKVYDTLKNNLKKNSSSDVDLKNFGLWKDEETLEFFAEGGDGGRIRSKSDNEKITKIQTKKLSTYLNEEVELLKLDIEGAEFEVIQEIKDKLDKIKRVFIEYHSFSGQDQKLAELLTILKEAGFRVSVSSPGLVSQNPFFKVNEFNGMDGQLNIFAYR